MRFRSVKNVKIINLVIERVSINVVDYLSSLGASYFSVLPLASVPIRAITKPVTVKAYPVMAVGLFMLRSRWVRFRHFCNWRYHHVSPARMSARFQAINLPFIGVERIPMLSPHLIMSHAHFPSGDRSVAVLAGSPDDDSSPPVIRRPVLLHSLVVHQAKAMSGMFSAASFNFANSVLHRRSHRRPFSLGLLNILAPYTGPCNISGTRISMEAAE